MRFFHESFFDYCFGRTFFAAEYDRDLVEWLAQDQQALFRRSQVRQVLAFLRRESHNRGRYLRTLAALLADPRIRFHIKEAGARLASLLGRPNPRRVGNRRGSRRWTRRHTSGPPSGIRRSWFDVLLDVGRWGDWLGTDQETIEPAIRLLSMPDVLDARGEQVANLIQRHRDDSAEWRGAVMDGCGGRGHGYDSPEMQQLLLELIASGPNDGVVSELSKYINQSMLLYGLSDVKRRPSPQS